MMDSETNTITSPFFSCGLDCQIFHKRHWPKNHQFKYSSFQILFDTEDQNFLEILKKQTWGFIKLNSKKYLSSSSITPQDSSDEIQSNKLTIDSKIRNFLSEKLNYSAENIYLQTTPQFGGYVFNPVSFWYCFKKTKLDAVLCEVNNTFGEKHFYWLKIEGQNNHWIWSEKEFHVSPFFEVKGLYKFRFSNQLDISNKSSIGSSIGPSVDIQYYSTDQKLLLTTWVHSKKISPHQISLFSIIKAYGFFTFMIIFRIHFQAFILFIKKIKIYRKPIPPKKEFTYESSVNRS